MEVAAVSRGDSRQLSSLNKYNISNVDQVVINNTFNFNGDKVDVGIDDLIKGLSISGQKIIDKLNEILKKDLPDGIASLKPEDTTPEATSDRIVKGATAFFDVFKKQNANLSDEEVLTKFMETIRGGIKTGYDDAFNTLEGLGAFKFDGVQDGVEKTKALIEEKLKSYEAAKRQELGLDPTNVGGQVATQVTQEVLRQGSQSVYKVA